MTAERSDPSVERNWVDHFGCCGRLSDEILNAGACSSTDLESFPSTASSFFLPRLDAAEDSNRKRDPANKKIAAAMANHKIRLPIISGVNGIGRVLRSLTVQYLVAWSKGAEPNGSDQAASPS